MIKNSIVNETVDRPIQDRRSKVRLPQVRFPLRAKITLPFLILAVGLAIGAAYVITQIIFDTIDERYTNQLIESGKLSSGLLLLIKLSLNNLPVLWLVVMDHRFKQTNS